MEMERELETRTEGGPKNRLGNREGKLQRGKEVEAERKAHRAMNPET